VGLSHPSSAHFGPGLSHPSVGVSLLRMTTGKVVEFFVGGRTLLRNQRS
jgi:hypothetical protein